MFCPKSARKIVLSQLISDCEVSNGKLQLNRHNLEYLILILQLNGFKNVMSGNSERCVDDLGCFSPGFFSHHVIFEIRYPV